MCLDDRILKKLQAWSATQVTMEEKKKAKQVKQAKPIPKPYRYFGIFAEWRGKRKRLQ